MKFDVVVGNPPYQKAHTNGGSNQDLYPHFVLLAKQLAPHVVMITPHRWLFKHQLKWFKEKMVDGTITTMRKWANKDLVFGKGVRVEGGVSYFHIDASNSGFTIYTKDGKEWIQLNLAVDSTRFPSHHLKSILGKVADAPKLDKHIQRTHCITSNSPHILPTGDVKIHISNGRHGYITKELATSYSHHLDYGKWKLLIPNAGSINRVPDKTIICSPSEVQNESKRWIVCSSEQEAYNILSWLQTTTIRFLPMLEQQNHSIFRVTYSGTPACPDISKHWTDQDVMDLFGITNEENEWMKKCVEEFCIDDE